MILGENREVGAYWGQESWCQCDDDGWHINEWCRYGGAPLVGKRAHPYAEDELADDWYSCLKPAPEIAGFQ